MNGDSGQRKDTQRAFAMAAVGMEMVVPVLLGWWLDSYLRSSPWGVMIGGVVGFTGAIWHMVVLSREDEGPRKDPPSPPGTGSP